MSSQSKETMKLNVGCGDFYAQGWTNIDITKVDGGPQPDVVAPADKLPFRKSSATHVYAGHVLEHIALEDIPAVLAEFDRVLRKTGQLMIVGPDLDRALQSFPEVVNDIRYGGSRWEGDKHLWESTEAKTIELLQTAGYTVESIPIEYVDESVWPVTSKIGWQFALLATR